VRSGRTFCILGAVEKPAARSGLSNGEAPVAASVAAVLQYKLWLKGLSPMIWRRVQVSEDTTLHELHGIIQVAMGWEGIHLFTFNLRAVRYGSYELGARSPNITLGDLQLRKGARFAYEYDLNIPWEQNSAIGINDRKSRREPPGARHGSLNAIGHG
jgi:hypothetical protein